MNETQKIFNYLRTQKEDPDSLFLNEESRYSDGTYNYIYKPNEYVKYSIRGGYNKREEENFFTIKVDSKFDSTDPEQVSSSVLFYGKVPNLEFLIELLKNTIHGYE